MHSYNFSGPALDSMFIKCWGLENVKKSRRKRETYGRLFTFSIAKITFSWFFIVASSKMIMLWRLINTFITLVAYKSYKFNVFGFIKNVLNGNSLAHMNLFSVLIICYRTSILCGSFVVYYFNFLYGTIFKNSNSVCWFNVLQKTNDEVEYKTIYTHYVE